MKLENEQSSLFSLFGYYLQLLLFFFTTLNRIILLDLTLNWFPWMPTLLNSLLILFFYCVCFAREATQILQILN